jgi:dihydroorotate dehydrogenase (NAD+) catalytic subunit
MINSVGLQGPGVKAWLDEDLGPLLATGARVVASIWGRSVDSTGGRRSCWRALASASRSSQPLMPQHRGGPRPVRPLTVGYLGRPRRQRATAGAVGQAQPQRPQPGRGGAARAGVPGGHAGQHGDGHGHRPRDRRFRLGSAPPVAASRAPPSTIAVRAVFDVHRALPSGSVVGVGGIARGVDAAEMMLAGATAVRSGRPVRRPPGPGRVLDELQAWKRRQESPASRTRSETCG